MKLTEQYRERYVQRLIDKDICKDAEGAEKFLRGVEWSSYDAAYFFGVDYRTLKKGYLYARDNGMLTEGEDVKHNVFGLPKILYGGMVVIEDVLIQGLHRKQGSRYGSVIKKQKPDYEE